MDLVCSLDDLPFIGDSDVLTLCLGQKSSASSRVPGNAELGVFLHQLLVLYAYIFLLGILIYAKFFFLLTRLKLLKSPEDDSRSPNLASATKDQKIPANPMPQGLS